jgi:hypothetical protein
MEPIAAGVMVMMAVASLIGVLIGAIGAAVTWRWGIHPALGALVTALVLPLFLLAIEGGDLTWLRPRVIWGMPLLMLAFLTCSIAAGVLAERFPLHRNVIALTSFGLAIAAGLVLVRAIGITRVMPRAAWGASLALALILGWRLRGRRPPGSVG